jgi:hypothetical protein
MQGTDTNASAGAKPDKGTGIPNGARAKPASSILVVEDDRDVAAVLRLHPEDAFYRVAVAYDGNRGLDLALHAVKVCEAGRALASAWLSRDGSSSYTMAISKCRASSEADLAFISKSLQGSPQHSKSGAWDRGLGSIFPPKRHPRRKTSIGPRAAKATTDLM